jgi:hypothetical protein
MTNFPNCPEIGANTSSPSYYPDNKVTVDPNATALLVLIPSANFFVQGAPYYQAAPSELTTNREELFRIDQTISNKWRGFYRFIYDSWATVNSAPTFQSNSFPTVQNSFAGPGIDMVANLTYAATPSLVNEFVADYTTDHITLTNISTGIGRGNFTGNGFFDNGYGGVLPSISVGGGSAYGGGFNVGTGYFPWQNSNPTYSYRDDLTKTLKNHTLIFGVSFIAAQKNEPSVGNNQGSFSFSTSEPSPRPRPSPSTTTATRSSSLTSRTTGASLPSSPSTSASASACSAPTTTSATNPETSSHPSGPRPKPRSSTSTAPSPASPEPSSPAPATSSTASSPADSTASTPAA